MTHCIETIFIKSNEYFTPNTPRWADHSHMYVFSKKLRETIRFELIAWGSIPTSFQAYLGATISVERNQAAQNSIPAVLPASPPFLPP